MRLVASKLPGLKQPELAPQGLLVFDKRRVHRNTRDRTDLHTLRLVEVSDAFSTLVRIDFIYFRPKENRVVRALWLTNIAIDALIGNDQSHGMSKR